MTKSANYCIWQNITINLGRRIKTGCVNEELFVGMVVRAFLCGGGGLKPLLRQALMGKKSLTYSAVLLFGLVFVSVLLIRGVIQGAHSNNHVALTTDQSVYT